MPLTAIIAGPYTATYDSNDLGQTQDGFRLLMQMNKEVIRSSAYGDSVVDSVYRGGDVFLNMVGIEYGKLSDSGVLNPYGETAGAGIDTTTFGTIGQAGRLDMGSDLISATVLTVVDANTTAGGIGSTTGIPTTLTAANSIIDENSRLEHHFAPRARIVPLSLRCYPETISNVDRWISTTSA